MSLECKRLLQAASLPASEMDHAHGREQKRSAGSEEEQAEQRAAKKAKQAAAEDALVDDAKLSFGRVELGTGLMPLMQTCPRTVLAWIGDNFLSGFSK